MFHFQIFYWKLLLFMDHKCCFKHILKLFPFSIFSKNEKKKKIRKLRDETLKAFCSHRVPKSILCSLNINKKFCTNIKLHIWIIQWHFFFLLLYLLTL
jgi:hypothetical protein